MLTERTIACVTAVVLAVSPAMAEKYAILVGVNQCPDFRLPDSSKPRPLRGAEADADAVARFLIENYGFASVKVRLLKGSEATFATIKRAMGDAARDVRPGDAFVFHFSGHGTRVPDPRTPGGRGALSEAICPCDTTERGENLIVDHDLGVWLARINAAQITVILDCCHAETEMKEPDDDLAVRYLPIPIAASRPAKDNQAWPELRNTTKNLDRSQTLFFACHADQQAYERRFPGAKPGTRRGQFTHYFLEALRDGTNQRGGPGNEAVMKCVQRRLEETFNRARSAHGERQEPVVASDDPAGPVFGLNGQKASALQKPKGQSLPQSDGWGN